MEEKELWEALRAQGFNEYATAGIMGNMRAESGLHPDRVQGDIPYSAWSQEYTAMVDSGKVSRDDFIYRGAGGGGYGIFQWTFWSRKKDFYDFCKKAGTSIGDGKMQVGYFTYEVSKNYRANVYEPLLTVKSVWEAAILVMLKYVRPGDQSEENQQRRAGYSLEFYEKYAEEKGGTEMAENYPLLKSGSKGTFVKKCQELLLGMGYALPRYGADGEYGGETVEAVKSLQRDQGLEVDGECGPETWAALLRGETQEETPGTIGKAAGKVIAIAKSEVGYIEKASNDRLDDKTANAGSANYTKYARDLDAIEGFYNGKKQGFPYCDVGVDWCHVQAFGAEKAKKVLYQPDRSTGAGCKFSAGFYRQAGQFFSYPEPGDQIFFGEVGNEYHTGIVYAVDSSRVYTVEWNTSGTGGVVANGGGVWEKSYALSNSQIAGYGRPNWSIVENDLQDEPEEPKEDEQPEKPAETGTEAVTLDVLKKGAKGAQVKAAQLLLIGRGFSCGAAGADGDFGTGTYNAVKKFQQLYELLDDGEIGGETWTRLLKG